MAETRVLYQNDVPTPLGTIRVAAEQRGTPGLSPGRMRVFGGYAVVLLQNGEGWYRDVTGGRRPLSAHDAILVLPDVPHSYRSRRLTGWDEWYLTFDGPAFDLLRNKGVLPSDSLVQATSPEWRSRFVRLLSLRPETDADRLRHVGALFELLVDVLGEGSPRPAGDGWVELAKAALERNLEARQPVSEVAAQLGMTEQAFRKRFARLAGVSPARYRADRRLTAAANLLRQTTMPLRDVAEALGFVDEFHLSKRFKDKFGIAPGQYRTLTD